MATKPSAPETDAAAKSTKSGQTANNLSDPANIATIHDQQLHRGDGGELHQLAKDGQPVLTTAQGSPVADDQNTLRVGARGPALIDDFHFREKIFHFDHERIPERVVHARGYGAHGFLRRMNPSRLTRARTSFSVQARKRRSSYVSRQLPATKAQLTLHATFAGLQSRCIRRRATGIWLAITFQCSLSRTPLSFRIWSTQPSRNPTVHFRKPRPPMTISGTSSA